MASSRDVLNAFTAHVDDLVTRGRVDEANSAWRDFLANVAPSFGDEHRREAVAKHAAFRAGLPRDDEPRTAS